MGAFSVSAFLMRTWGCQTTLSYMMRHSFPFVCDTGTICCGAPVHASWWPLWSQEKTGVPSKVQPTQQWQANKHGSLCGAIFLGKRCSLKCTVWDVNTHIHRKTDPCKYTHIQEEDYAHGWFSVFPRSYTRVHLLSLQTYTHTHTHTQTELIEEKGVYSLICYRIQGVTLIYICIWSAMEYRE